MFLEKANSSNSPSAPKSGIAMLYGGIGFGDAGNLLESSATEPLADLTERGSLGIGKAHTGREARPQNAGFGGEVFVLEQQPLVHQAGDVRQQARPLVFLH